MSILDGSPLAGKTALVTGASRGIGKGCALELAAAGAAVYVTGRTVSPGQHPLPGTVGATAEEITAAGGSAVAVACDHRDDDAVRAVFNRIASECGRLDVLVNNAFIVTDELTSGLPFWEVPISNWDDMIDVGTRSAYVASVMAAPVMIGQGDGLIANISSSGAAEYAWHVAYGVGKCALDRMTADCARELRDTGVSMVSVWPGFVRTERIDVAIDAGVELPVHRAGGYRPGHRRRPVPLHRPGGHLSGYGRRVRLHRRRRQSARRSPPRSHRLTARSQP